MQGEELLHRGDVAYLLDEVVPGRAYILLEHELLDYFNEVGHPHA